MFPFLSLIYQKVVILQPKHNKMLLKARFAS